MTACETQNPRTHVFIVRLWNESLDQDTSEWRGQVKHVPSGNTRYFLEWVALVEYLKAMLAGAEEDESIGPD